MAKVWTIFREVSAYARSWSTHFAMVVEIKRVEGGWVVPTFTAISNRIDRDAYEAEVEVDDIFRYGELESIANEAQIEDCGDGSSGLSSTCGETLAEGYELFNRKQGAADDGGTQKFSAMTDRTT